MKNSEFWLVGDDVIWDDVNFSGLRKAAQQRSGGFAIVSGGGGVLGGGRLRLLQT